MEMVGVKETKKDSIELSTVAGRLDLEPFVANAQRQLARSRESDSPGLQRSKSPPFPHEQGVRSMDVQHAQLHSAMVQKQDGRRPSP
jgi:hypothetical protein